MYAIEPCGLPYNHNGDMFECRLAYNHDGDCADDHAPTEAPPWQGPWL